MSLGSPSNRVAPLGAALAGVLWLAGCAAPGTTEPEPPLAGTPGAPSETAGPVELYSGVVAWETIEGGYQGQGLVGEDFVRFRRPVAVAANGNDLYVADAGRDLLYRVDRATGTLSILLDLRTALVGEPTDLYVGPDGSFYITDPTGKRVLYFNAEGTLIRSFSDDVNMLQPVSVVVDEHAGRVYIADGLRDTVMVFDRLGNLFGAIGERGDGPGQFRMITAIGLAPDGLVIASRMGERLQVMGFDGAYLYTIDDSALVFPTALVVDSSGLILVSDFHDNMIKFFRGKALEGRFGGSGGGPGRFRYITDLWLEPGVVYVADSLNGRIQVLRFTPGGD